MGRCKAVLRRSRPDRVWTTKQIARRRAMRCVRHRPFFPQPSPNGLSFGRNRAHAATPRPCPALRPMLSRSIALAADFAQCRRLCPRGQRTRPRGVGGPTGDADPRLPDRQTRGRAAMEQVLARQRRITPDRGTAAARMPSWTRRLAAFCETCKSYGTTASEFAQRRGLAGESAARLDGLSESGDIPRHILASVLRSHLLLRGISVLDFQGPAGYPYRPLCRQAAVAASIRPEATFKMLTCPGALERRGCARKRVFCRGGSTVDVSGRRFSHC